MAAIRKKRAGRPISNRPRAVRASVSLPPEVYKTLGDLAKKKKVSTSWVLRDAAEKYIKDEWPLLSLSG